MDELELVIGFEDCITYGSSPEPSAWTRFATCTTPYHHTKDPRPLQEERIERGLI